MGDYSRIKRLKYNIFTSLFLQIVTAFSGIILPRFLLLAFGSDTNGLVSSITQFLGYITLLESGVGGVIKASLYKPLAEYDNNNISRVVNACKTFFKSIAYIFVGYLIVLAFAFPCLPSNEIFPFEFVFFMVLILGINVFIQYYFSITYQILIQADQRGYIVDLIQILMLIANLVITIALIKLGYNIHIVKFGSAMVYLAKPLFINLYVKKHYSLSCKAEPNKDAISQRWDGLGHHLAYFAHKNTDIVILTLFSSLKQVSVYSIYNMIVANIQIIVNSFSNAFSATLGNIISKKEDILKRFFCAYECFLYVVSNVVFSVSLYMITPFVKIYTFGVNDVNYEQPIFAILIVLAEFFYTVRGSYNNLVTGSGHFKQTKKYAFAEAGLNIILSIILVHKFGLIGVALGTMTAMLYRLLTFVWYVEKNILQGVITGFCKNICISIASFLLLGVAYKLLNFGNIITFRIWIVYAIIITVMAVVIQVVLQLIFNKKAFIDIYSMFKNQF